MPEVITNNLDLWTSALLTKSTAGRGSNGKQEAYGIKKLRELILELAVRGKLVPQDPNDEPASVLLEMIATEKTRLIKEGKIKKDDPLPEITDEQIPYIVPRGWQFARLGNITNKIGSGSTPRGGKSAYVDSGIAFLRSQNVWNHGLEMDDVAYITVEMHEKMSNTVVEPNDILLNITGASLGRCAIYPEDLGEANVSQHVTIIRPTETSTRRYLHYCILSPYTQALVWGRQVGMAREGLSKKVLEQFEIPLPPPAEQHRIVAKVEELMALCDQLEQQQTHSLEAHQTLVEILLGTLTSTVRPEPVEGRASTVRHAHGSGQTEIEEAWTRIATHFDTLFTTEHSINQLKQTILQLAVMGKLVPQDPNDEPVSVFLEKVAQQKAKLIKAGKIRKQKELPKIKDDEIGFKLSAGWAVSRLGTFTNVGTGATPSRDKTAYWSPQEVSWVASGETNYDFIAETSERISSLALKETNVTVYPVGTLIVAMYGQGKTRGQVSELMIEAGTNQACAAVVLINEDEAHRKYLKLFFKKAYEEMRSHSAGGAQPNLNVGKISNTVVPIPPLPEQHRIVAKVDELMALCGALKARLADAQTTQLHLADAIVEQAIV